MYICFAFVYFTDNKTSLLCVYSNRVNEKLIKKQKLCAHIYIIAFRCAESSTTANKSVSSKMCVSLCFYYINYADTHFFFLFASNLSY